MSGPSTAAGRLFADGQREEALAYAARSMREGDDLLEWVRFALAMRDAGRHEDAKALLSLIVAQHPAFPPASYELAFLHRLEGNHRRAAALLRSALGRDPTPFRTQMFFAHMLHASAAHHEAAAVLAATRAATAAERAEVERMVAFGRYLARNPLSRSLVLYDQLLAKNTWLTTDQLAAEISSAVAQRRPFALVRLGDGEGGVLRLDGKDEADYGPLYDQNRQDLIAMWFGQSFPWRTNGFLELASNLVQDLDTCDVVGIPYESWIRHEYQISSMRGVPSLVNAVHALLAQQGAPRRFVSQLAHLDLLRSNKLAEIVAAARRISLISCLDALPAALKSKFDLEEVSFYRIPGEQGSRHILGEDTVRGTHYPDRYRELQDQLSRPHEGRLFLIAGGLLGKLYAMTIRRFGGIAIDIGSVVDIWVGHATRPSYGNDDALL